MIIVDLLCKNNHRFTWRSQSLKNGMAFGNIKVSAAILFSGNTFQRIKEMMNISNVSFLGQSTFYCIQKKLLYPAIHRVYTTNRTLLIENAKEKSEVLHLLGDGRCDSPGYNAKYGTYTLMDSHSGYILDFHISHVRLAGNSQRMELDGFKKVVERLQDFGIKIGSITTDRHKQIRAYMRKFLKHILQQFDVWHVGKNIKKKVAKLAKKKSCRDLNEWIKAIVNHFWWCCASCGGDTDNLKEKWISILYHISDRHTWKGGKTFKKCQHKKLTKAQRSRKPFLKRSSNAYKALESVVMDKSLLNALPHLTKFNHTGTLEVYHSLYNKFSPKRLHFGLEGMIARAELAVLDFNCGVGIDQAKTKSGKLRFKQQYSKVTQSWVVKTIREPKDRVYIQHLMNEVIHIQTTNEIYHMPKLINIPKTIAQIERPDKDEAIKNVRTRFSF